MSPVAAAREPYVPITRLLVIVGGIVLLASCASSSVNDAPSIPADTPDVARVVCEPDGSTTVQTPNVRARRDGVHLVVVDRLDEPASVNGLGFDVDPGRSTWVTALRPGEIALACWPFSQHTSGAEPATSSLTVWDPDRLFVDGELQCTPDDHGSALDIHLLASPGGDRNRSITPEEARPLIGGLRSDDQVLLPGYPDAAHQSVVVVRGDRRIAIVGFAYRGEHWIQAGGHVCGGSTEVA